MRILISHRRICFCLLIAFLFHSSLVLAQPYRVTPLNHPDGTFSVVGINNNGQIAGTVTDTNFVSHAVRREADGQFTPLPELAGNISVASGMNESGHVLGQTLDESFDFQTVIWEDTDLRILDPIENVIAVIPIDVNNAGVATGYLLDTTFASHAVVWNAAGTVQNLPELDSVQSSVPAAINENGEIVGTMFLANGWSRAILWQPSDTGYSATDLGTLGGLGAFATDINNHGQIVGYSYPEEGGFNVHAFFWDNNQMIDLGTFGGDNSWALAITDDAFIVGAAQYNVVAKSNTNYGMDLTIWREFLNQFHFDNKFAQPMLNLKSPQQSSFGGAFYTEMRKNRFQEYITPTLTPFSANIDSVVGFNEVDASNLSRFAIGVNTVTEQRYALLNYEVRYTDPGATEEGSPGRAYSPYSSFTEALFDESQDIFSFLLYALPELIYPELATPMNKKVFLNTYTGSGSTLRHQISGSSLSIAEIVVSSGSSLKFSRYGIDRINAQRVDVSGELFARGISRVHIEERLSVNNPAARVIGYFVTGPTGKISLNLGFIEGMVMVDDPGYETDLVGRHNAAPGTGVIEGGSGASAINGKVCRHVNSATGENGGYAFQLSLSGAFYVPAFVFIEETPAAPQNVIIEARSGADAPTLNFDNVDVEGVLLNSLEQQWGVKIVPRNNGKRAGLQQSLTATIRVAVDSIDTSDDPNRYRLLLFDWTGELIGEAGTLVPASESPPVSAVYTGFIDSLLNVSYRDVSITDSVILVLASGDLQTDLTAEDETGIIKTFELAQNFPNPFNPETIIQYQVPRTSRVRLIVYNILGQPVRTLFDGEQTTGKYSRNWNMLNESGHAVSSGVYMYRMEAQSDNGASYVKTRKMIVLR